MYRRIFLKRERGKDKTAEIYFFLIKFYFTGLFINLMTKFINLNYAVGLYVCYCRVGLSLSVLAYGQLDISVMITNRWSNMS